MLGRMIAMLQNVASNVKVVGAPEKYAQFEREMVSDGWPGEGPLGGIITALENAGKSSAHTEWNVIVSCDMPFLMREWMEFLVARATASKAHVVVPHSAQGPEPLCACWRTDSAETLRGAFERGVRKVTEGIALLRSEVLDESAWKRFDSAGRLFWNMNTAADFEEARRVWETERA